jgi:hypothetical protein
MDMDVAIEGAPSLSVRVVTATAGEGGIPHDSADLRFRKAARAGDVGDESRKMIRAQIICSNTTGAALLAGPRIAFIGDELLTNLQQHRERLGARETLR